MKFYEPFYPKSAVKAGSSNTFELYPIKETPPILLVRSGCGCTKPHVKEGGVIEVVFKPEPIPFHLKHLGQYSPSATIFITYKGIPQEEIVHTQFTVIK